MESNTPGNKMPVKYMKAKDGLRVHANNVKKTWVLMFNDQVVNEKADANIIIRHFEDLEASPCWIQVNNHYPEDSQEIARRIKNILGQYYHEGKGIVVERRNKGDRIEVTLKVHFYKCMPLVIAEGLMNHIDEIITPSFGPSGKIELSMEIP